MKEITRIHIAKVSYDIEAPAKKQLETYIGKLEQYAEDQELLQDIEIRITELLAERGVAKDSVIAVDDVVAIREQLGEPKEFLGDGDMAVGADIERAESSRRLYRDIDNAALGGVLSGVAGFFHFNPLWARLAFIILLLVSFGTAALVYVVLWIAIPPARTAAEKLQLSGKPVTLHSIRELNELNEGASENKTAKLFQRTIVVALGIFSAFSAIGTLALTVWATIALVVTNTPDAVFGFSGELQWAGWLITSLMALSGLLLTALFSLVAYMSFAGKITKRLVLTGVIIILAGVVTSGSALGTGLSQTWRLQNEAQAAVRTTLVELPADFATTVTELRIESGEVSLGFGDYANLQVEYIVDNNDPRYSLTALPGVKPKITTDGNVASISFSSTSELKKYNYAAQRTAPSLRIYGPALAKIEVNKGSLTYAGKTQESLIATTQDRSYLEVTGEYKTVTATANGSSSIALNQSSVEVLTASIEVGARVTAGTIRQLVATQPSVCPDSDSGYGSYSQNTNQTRIVVRAVTSGMVMLNNAELPAKNHESPCALLIVGDENEYDNAFNR